MGYCNGKKMSENASTINMKERKEGERERRDRQTQPETQRQLNTKREREREIRCTSVASNPQSEV